MLHLNNLFAHFSLLRMIFKLWRDEWKATIQIQIVLTK